MPSTTSPRATKEFKILWFLSVPLTRLMTVKTPVKSLADMKGLRIRSASATETEGLKLLEATPIGMPISEVSISLQKGIIERVFTPLRPSRPTS